MPQQEWVKLGSADKQFPDAHNLIPAPLIVVTLILRTAAAPP